MACGFNFQEIRLLPPDGAESTKFGEYCSRFRVPEVERDLLEVEDTKLVEASEYHMISVSCNHAYACFVLHSLLSELILRFHVFSLSY